MDETPKHKTAALAISKPAFPHKTRNLQAYNSKQQASNFHLWTFKM